MIRTVLAGIAACVAMVGCSTAPDAPQASPSLYFHDLIARAEAAGANEQQMAVLYAATGGDGVSYADVDALMNDFFECARAAGLQPERLPDRPIAPSVKAPDYAVGHGSYGPDEGNLLSEDCLIITVDFAMEALHQQPSSIEALDDDILKHRAQIAECTGAQGYPLADDASIDEIDAAVLGALRDSQVLCYEYLGP